MSGDEHEASEEGETVVSLHSSLITLLNPKVSLLIVMMHIINAGVESEASGAGRGSQVQV